MISVDQWLPFKESDFTSNKQLKTDIKRISFATELKKTWNITDEFNKTCARPIK